MHPSALFIKRPIATSLLMLGIALFGVIAYRNLPVSDLPNVDYPTITVSVGLPGADPTTMASAVATPMERQFTSIAGLDSMTSTSSNGSSSVTLQFDLSRDIDGAAVDVQTAIAEVMPLLPAGLPAPPSFRKVNPSESPIMFLGVYSDTMPMWKLDEYAETMMAQRLSMVSGVAQVGVWGSQKYAVHVQVDPDRLASRQVGLNEVSTALQSWNINSPTGTLYGPHTAYNIQASGQLFDADSFKPMIVAYRNGSPIRLSEVANVIDSAEDTRTSGVIFSKDDKPRRCISLMVMRQPGSNVIEVTDSIKRLLPFFQAQLPPSVHLFIRGDRSKNIRQAFRDMQFTMAVTLGLVIMVIFLFLRNASATLIPSMALPFSILGTFAVMYMCDYTLDNLSMMALILCIGFVVDDAIVMLENIVRHMEKGETALQAAMSGSKEIGFTIVSMTISLAAVFIPVLFMGGLLGRLFREFAVTICVAILISGVVSITLTPMLCSRFLRHTESHKKPWISRKMDTLFDAMLKFYDWSLGMVLRARPVMAVVFFVVLGATIYMFGKVQKGFIPTQDMDSLQVTTDAAQGTSYVEMERIQRRAAEVIAKDPDIENVNSSVGGNSFGSSSNQGHMMVTLKPRADRESTLEDIINRVRPQISGFPGIRVFMSAPQSIRVGGRQSKATYQFTVSGPDTDQLYKQAQQLERVIARLPGLRDVNTDLQLKNPRANIIVDRDKTAALGLSVVDIQNALYDGYGTSWASTIYAPNNQYKVLLEVLPKYQEHLDLLSKIYFKSPTMNTLIPLDAVVKIKEDAGPQSINHSGQLPSVTISFDLLPGVSLGDAVDEIQEAVHSFPGRLTANFQGTAQVFQSSMKNMTLLMVVAILVVYIVLGVLYESYVHPLTILSGLPSAGFGALLTLILFKTELNIYSFVGLIMLIGIVKKNAIMQIDFALEVERKEGKTPAEAIYQGCLIRFRPIMMTTMAALLGAVPMALGIGAGGEARRPLGLAVAGGLLFSQLITLYLTPVVYTYMAGVMGWWRGRKGKPAVMGAPEGQLSGA